MSHHRHARQIHDEEQGFLEYRPCHHDANALATQDFWQRLVRKGLCLSSLSSRESLSPVFYADGDQTIINLAGLQRLNLLALQKPLVDNVGILVKAETVDREDMDQEKLRRIKQAMTDIKIAMSDYVSALRDSDYMKDLDAKLKANHKDRWFDPFIIRTAKTLDLCMMMDAELVVRGRRMRPSRSYANTIKPEDLHAPDIPGDSRGAFNRDLDWTAFVWRFFACLFAAIALLVPMLVMVLNRGLHTAIITVCISVFLTAIVIAKFSQDSFGAVVGYVAAYTAVLVVFVGATS